jgi:hypothetical protein
LDIHAETPEEIAVSIMAEIIKLWSIIGENMWMDYQGELMTMPSESWLNMKSGSHHCWCD